MWTAARSRSWSMGFPPREANRSVPSLKNRSTAASPGWPRRRCWCNSMYSNPGMPVADSQLERVAAIAQCRGLKPASVSQARVLEIGCAGGGRSLLMAESHPQGNFLGVDESAESIAEARGAASALGLTNVEFRQADFSAPLAGSDKFDYIICQRAYS